MNILGLIGTGAAFVNYRKAKNELAELTARKDTLCTALGTYQQYADQQKRDAEERLLYDYEQSIIAAEAAIDYVDNPSDLQVTSVLRVGNLVGKYYRAQCSLVFSNTSDHDYYVGFGEVECYFKDAIFATGIWESNFNYKNKWTRIPAGQTVEIGYSKTVYKANEQLDELRQYICNYCGKKLITSCPKVSIDDMVESATILFRWVTDIDNVPEDEGDVINRNEVYNGGDVKRKWTVAKTACYRNKPGVLRYCGEAFV